MKNIIKLGMAVATVLTGAIVGTDAFKGIMAKAKDAAEEVADATEDVADDVADVADAVADAIAADDIA